WRLRRGRAAPASRGSRIRRSSRSSATPRCSTCSGCESASTKRRRFGMHASQKRHDGPRRSPPPASSCERWGGVGGGGRLRLTATPPTRHLAFGAAPPSPPLRGGEGWCPLHRLSSLRNVCIPLALAREPQNKTNHVEKRQ